jgi:hypothetical protein
MDGPKGESASTTRAAIANASSNAIRDEQVVVGMIRSELNCGDGPAPVLPASQSQDTGIGIQCSVLVSHLQARSSRARGSASSKKSLTQCQLQ